MKAVIKIEDTTRGCLKASGTKGETYDTIILRLLEHERDFREFRPLIEYKLRDIEEAVAKADMNCTNVPINDACDRRRIAIRELTDRLQQKEPENEPTRTFDDKFPF